MRVLALLLAFTVGGSAQTESMEARGKRVVQEALTTLGGDAFLKMQNRVEYGRAFSFYRERLRGLSVATFYTEYLEQADVPKGERLLTRERQSFGKDERAATVFVGAEGYQLTFRGPQKLPEDQILRYRETNFNNIFYILRKRMKEPGMIIESQGSEIIDNMPTEKVVFTDADNRSVLVYFHKSTKLPVKQVFQRRDPLTKERIEEVSRFGKYRDVGGVQWPFDVSRERNGEKIYEMYAEKVEINQQLKPELFQVGK